MRTAVFLALALAAFTYASCTGSHPDGPLADRVRVEPDELFSEVHFLSSGHLEMIAGSDGRRADWPLVDLLRIPPARRSRADLVAVLELLMGEHQGDDWVGFTDLLLSDDGPAPPDYLGTNARRDSDSQSGGGSVLHELICATPEGSWRARTTCSDAPSWNASCRICSPALLQRRCSAPAPTARGVDGCSSSSCQPPCWWGPSLAGAAASDATVGDHPDNGAVLSLDHGQTAATFPRTLAS